jgi:glycosyltransferase involved in cell wall biosynthesis
VPPPDPATARPAPAVSVVMTVFNHRPFVQDAVDSLLAQDYRDFELLVVDDGSTDGSAAAVTGRPDPRLRLVRLAHQGRVAALNHAVALARGRYLAVLDADDLALPGRLALPVRFLDANPRVGAVGSAVQPLLGATGRRATRRLPRSDAAIRLAFLVRNPMFHSSVTYRAAALADIGGFDPAVSSGIDNDALLRLAARWRLANLDTPLAVKRVHPGQFFAAGTDRRRRGAGVIALRWRAARELPFPVPLRPVAYLIAALASARTWLLTAAPHPGRTRTQGASR